MWKKKWINGEKPPKHLDRKPHIWDAFIQYWQSEDAKKVSTRNSKNHNSDRGGKGLSTHNGGATSAPQRRVQLKKKYVRDPNLLEIVVDRHTNKKTNEIQDPMVLDYITKVKEAMEARLTQLSTDGSNSVDSLPDSDINKIVEETIPVKKGR